jgi:hypothetical protein
MKNLLLLTLLILFGSSAYAQESGTLLVVSQTDCTLTIDADKTYEVQAATPLKIDLPAGSHIVQQGCIMDANGNAVVEVIEIKTSENLVMQLSAKVTQQPAEQVTEREAKRVTLINSEINVPGGLTIAAQDANGADYTTSGTPIFHYYFQKGDQVLLNIEKMNKKGTNSLAFRSYPDGNVIYSQQQFENLKGQRIDIQTDGIYVLQIETNYTFDRSLRLTIDRFINPDTEKVLDSKVEIRKKYDVVSVQEPTSFWLNSTSHETWKGGKSRITLPVQLPANTVEWYYIFSASRDQAVIDNTLQGFSLAKDLGGFLLKSTGYGMAEGVLSQGIDAITQPPGSDYCDVSLVDQNNFQLYESGAAARYYPEGSRSNIQSGKIRVVETLFTPSYLGFKNGDSYHGISVGVEVVAVTVTQYYSSVDGE